LTMGDVKSAASATPCANMTIEAAAMGLSNILSNRFGGRVINASERLTIS
jgi:hypothetical protein